MAAAALSGSGAALGADIVFRGSTLAAWSATGSWTGGAAPGRNDRAILGGTSATRINFLNGPAIEIGSVWIRDGSVVSRFDNEAMPEVHLYGTDGVGVQNDSAITMQTFFRRTVLENDISIRATNVNGGGYTMPNGLTVAGLWKGIDLNGHTLTFDMVNAVNRTDLGVAIRGQGDVVKIGAGVFATTAAHEYIGRLFVDAGSVVLTGGGSFANASEVNVKSGAVFDASGVAPGSATIQSLSGDGRVVMGNKRLDITNGSATVFGGNIETTGGLGIVGGTQVLSGANTYAGGTTIASGATLQLGNSGSGGSITGDVAANGTLAFQRADNWTFDSGVSGNGAIVQRGTGKTVMTGDSSSFTGNTTVQSGTLAVNGRLGGSMDVLSAARLQGSGIIGNTTNAGTIAPGNSLGTLTVAGNYAGNGGALEIESVLGGDNSATDKLVVTGNTSGSTNVRVINVGGSGAQTVEGIKVVDVGGTSGGSFTLVGGDYTFRGRQAVVAGAYAYTLQKNGSSTPTDGDWYLRSTVTEVAPSDSASTQPPSDTTQTVSAVQPLYQPGVPVYEAYAQSLQAITRLPTLQQRVGSRQWSEGGLAGGTGAWARTEGELRGSSSKHSTSGTAVDTDVWRVQAGADHALWQARDGGALVAGLAATYVRGNARARSPSGDGRVNTDGYGLGGTMTWYGANGVYADAQAQFTWYRSDLNSDLAGRMASGNHGDGKAFSLELGKRTEVGNALTLTPQAQLMWSQTSFDDFTDRFGARVSSQNGKSLLGRAGISIDHKNRWQETSTQSRSRNVYGIFNLNYEFLDAARVNVADVAFLRRDNRLWTGAGVGGSYAWNNDRTMVYAEASVNTPLRNFGDSYSVQLMAGLRARF
ncbi:autotransporter outer membrane beta-barrel domain-containing protein [Cupriavidus sp. SW-Y-13]|uniref:autotransporter family protein n=1 Tax=Cupriavidus sp. SW-Y-13 TaxID=2653854 RepID=UPI001365AABC|nr:autotransporter outer membrane beta-barrel domain-containing protein [Cupriavidus sp. SW-Y-13]